MATHINIFNPDWCEIIFVQRNKSYGAFEIRQTTGKRHLLAIMVTLTAFVTAITLPAIFHKEKITDKAITVEGNIDLQSYKDKLEPKKDIPQDVTIPNPNLLRSSIVFVPPVITPDAYVTEEDSAIHTMEQLLNTDRVISNIQIDGNDKGTVTPTQEIIAAPVDNTIHTYVGQMPQYPGGETELFKYLGESIKYPQIAVENGSSGTVSVQFVVFASGEIGNIKVVRGFDESCEKEAYRVIKSMNRWIPGKQNGNPVNVQMILPVRFKLQDQQ
jgi:protein TonB